MDLAQRVQCKGFDSIFHAPASGWWVQNKAFDGIVGAMHDVDELGVKDLM